MGWEEEEEEDDYATKEEEEEEEEGRNETVERSIFHPGGTDLL